MINIFLKWILSAVSLLLVSYLVPDFHIASIYSALIAAAILGLVNVLIKPFLIILTLPINILTLGLFTLVINAVMLLLVSSIVKGIEIRTFTAAIMGAVILWLVSFITNTILKEDGQS